MSKAWDLPKKSLPLISLFFTLNGTWLALYNRNALANDVGVDAHGTGFGGFALSHNVTTEKEVDEIFADAVISGASSVK